MTTIQEQREKLSTQSDMYDRMIRANKSNKKNAEKRLGILRKKKSESYMLMGRYRYTFEKLNRINNKFNYMKLLYVLGATSVLKIAQLILGIFSLGGILSIPVAIMYGVLALALGFKIGTEFFEAHNKGKYKKEERSSNTYQLHISRLEKELENYIAENKRIAKKKAVVDEGIKEIDECVKTLINDAEQINGQDLSENMTNVNQVNVMPHI